MKIKLFNTAILIALILCSCNKQDDMQKGIMTNITISASRETTPLTKTSYWDTPNALEVRWKADKSDKIGIFATNSITSNAQFSIAGELLNNDKTANFSGKIDVSNQNDAITLYGYYPYDASQTSKSAIAIDLSSQRQQGIGHVDLGAVDFMAATPITFNNASKMTANNISFSFNPLLTVMSFEITNPQATDMNIRSIRLETIENETPFYTSGSVDISDSNFPITHLENTSTNGLQMFVSGASIPAGDKGCFHMMIFPLTKKLPAQLKVIVKTDTRIYTQTKSTPLNGFVRGKRYIMEVDKLVENTVDEREILKAFYNATNGNSWINKTNWCSDKPLDEWFGISCRDGKVSSISLNNNNLSGYLLGELEKLNSLQSLILGHNNIEGNIPAEIAKMEKLTQLELLNNKMEGEIPQSVQQSRFFGLWDAKYGILPQQEGYGLTMLNDEAPDPLDGLVYTYIKSAKQNEVSIIMMGDGFINSDMGRNGKYENYLSGIADYILSVEPFKSYRDYFTFYFVNAVSKEEGISNEMSTKNTVFSTTVGLENSAGMALNQRLCYEYAEKTGITGDNGAILMIANTNDLGGSSGGRWREGGFAAITLTNDYKNVVLHELGHAFAWLGDEYISAPNQIFTGSWDVEHQAGMRLNIDNTNNPEKVIWKHFIGHPNYPMVGLYEGALWGKGIWRPEKKSCMDDNRPYFNAPSREAIVKRIKKLAKEQYSWDEFVSKDKYNPISDY